jgi:hypothetical protein
MFNLNCLNSAPMLKLQRKHFEPSKLRERFQILTPKVSVKEDLNLLNPHFF